MVVNDRHFDGFFFNILVCASYGCSSSGEPLAAQAQVIGSVNFIQGCIPRSWSQVQGVNLGGKVNGGRAWAVKVSGRLLSIGNGMWYKRNLIMRNVGAFRMGRDVGR